MKSQKVLVSAYACEPDKGSEPHVGWTWALAISRVAGETHVLTRANNRQSIQRALGNKPPRNLHFHYFDLPAGMQWWKKRLPVGTQLYYLLWQRAIGAFAQRLHERQQFDVAHHVTFAGMAYPPGVAQVPATFIWGPVGLVRVPPSLRPTLHPRARASELGHEALIWWASHSDTIQGAMQRAKVVVKFPNSELIGTPKGKIVLSGNMFIEVDRFPSSRRGHEQKELRLISLNRLIFLKGMDLGLEALALLKRKGMRCRWTIIGEGPERGRWQRSAKALGVGECVHFMGWQPRDAALEALKGANLMLHPAFREGCSASVLEGMAAALPVVCLDWGGPGFMVDRESGIKVSVAQSRESIVQGLAGAVEQLTDPSLRQRMGEAARRRVAEHFSPRALDEVVESLYHHIMK